MSSRFDECLPHILASEGGYVDHPNDRGGATNKGITQQVFNDWCRLTGRPARNVKIITDDEVRLIYKGGYWIPAHCDQLFSPLDLFVFDAAVNHGVKRAIVLLQRALDVDDDGIWGPQTKEALKDDVKAGTQSVLCKVYLEERKSFYDRIVQRDPSQAVFLKGWLARIDRLENEIC